MGRQGKKKQIPHCVRDDIAGGGAGRQPLLQGGQDVEEFVLAPAIDGEVLVQGQNIGGFKFIGQTNQAGVREIVRMEKLAGSLGISFLASEAGQARLKSQVTFTPVGAHELKGFEGKHEFFSC